MPLKTLIEFGLSEKEASIYLALLELDVAGASDLAEKTQINRSSVYVVLDALKEMGLVTSTSKVNPDNLVAIQEFRAASPDALLAAARDRSKHGQTVAAKIEAVVPKLKALHRDTKHRPSVAVYEGEHALELANYGIFYEQVDRGMNIYRFYGNISIRLDAELNVPEYSIKDHVHTLNKTAVHMCVISPKTAAAEATVAEYRKHGSTDEFKLVEPKLFNRLRGNLPAFAIYEDKIEFFSGDRVLVVIENKEMADVLKNVFDMAWAEGEVGKISDKAKVTKGAATP